MRRTNPGGHKDAMHDAVGNIFRNDGWDTLDIKGLGDGAPDWAMFKGVIGLLIEVKSPKDLVNRKADVDERGLTPKQQAFHARWKGPIFIIETVEEVWLLLDRQKVGELPGQLDLGLPSVPKKKAAGR